MKLQKRASIYFFRTPTFSLAHGHAALLPLVTLRASVYTPPVSGWCISEAIRANKVHLGGATTAYLVVCFG